MDFITGAAKGGEGTVRCPHRRVAGGQRQPQQHPAASIAGTRAQLKAWLSLRCNDPSRRRSPDPR